MSEAPNAAASELTAFIASEIVSRGTEVDPDTELLRSGLVDSLGVVEIVYWLEERIDVEIDPADVTIDNFGSVTRIVDYVDRLEAASA